VRLLELLVATGSRNNPTKIELVSGKREARVWMSVREGGRLNKIHKHTYTHTMTKQLPDPERERER
jgi:hypothetical protein